jgi:hypothetical protein
MFRHRSAMNLTGQRLTETHAETGSMYEEMYESGRASSTTSLDYKSTMRVYGHSRESTSVRSTLNRPEKPPERLTDLSNSIDTGIDSKSSIPSKQFKE